jgi:uncharacterized protein with FMN-binding domain
MKRAPIVLTGTACGLVAVIGYHAAAPQAAALTSSSSAGRANTATTATSSSTVKSSTTPATASTAKTSTTAAAATRSAVGSDAQYQYGDLEVKVTMTGSRITDVSVAKLDVYDPRSESIDQYAIPELRSEALSAQSANIDGVSGASYTSAAYEQSLQSAIDKLKA